MGSARAEKLYDRVFVEYGDDSVAQLGGVHLACEQSSQLLAKALEWGRLAAYLEQSTRYMRYDSRPGGRWRATVPPEIADTQLAERYVELLDDVFTTYGRMYDVLDAWYRERFPQEPGDPDFVYRQTRLTFHLGLPSIFSVPGAKRVQGDLVVYVRNGGAFQIDGGKLGPTDVFSLRHLIGTQPKAVLFQLSFCLLLYNALQVVRSHLAWHQNCAAATTERPDSFI